MGIKNLMQLAKELDGVIVDFDVSKLENKVVAVDTSIYIYKYLPGYLSDFYSALKDEMLLDESKRKNYEDGNTDSICSELCERILQLFNYIKSRWNVKFVFLLDGEFKPELKYENACKSRKSSKDDMRAKLQKAALEGDVDRVRKLLTYTYKIPSNFSQVFEEVAQNQGYQCITAPGEAETHACRLLKEGKVQYILTTDTDCLPMGCSIITHIDTHEGRCRMVRYEALLEETGLTEEQFVDFCILCGCDYNQKLPRIGVKRALSLIKKHGSIEKIGEMTDYDVSVLNAEQCRELFKIEL